MIPSPRRADLRRVLRGIGLASLLLSCGGDAGPPPQVEYARCWEVSLPGPVCARWPEDAPSLKLWVKAGPEQRVEIRADDRVLDAEGDDVQGGRRFQISIPEDASRIAVWLISPDGRRSPDWSIRLARRPTSRAPEMNRIDHQPAAQLSVELERLKKTVPPNELGLVLRTLALQYKGQDEQHEMLLEQGIAADLAARNIRGYAEKAGWLTRLYQEQGRLQDAQRILSGRPLPAGAPAEAKYWIAFYEGLQALKIGDYRTALEQLRQAADLADRVGMNSFRSAAELVLADVLQAVGLSEDASAMFKLLLAEFERLPEESRAKRPCDQAILLTNEAWTRLLAREGGEGASDPTPELEKALEIFEKPENLCEAARKPNARLNLAFAYLQGERWNDARRLLKEARRFESQADVEQVLWQLDLEGRLEIAEGRPAPALRSYDELAALAERVLSLDGRFRALLGRARARLALGQGDGAIAELAEADRLLDQQIWRIPLHEGRDTFLAQRNEATRLYLDLLLREGRTRDACDLARRARSRLLDQLTVKSRLARLSPGQQRAWVQAVSEYQALRNRIDREIAGEWSLSNDQKAQARAGRISRLASAQKLLDRAVAALGDFGSREPGSFSPPGPGEVVLVYHPLPRGWVGFAVHEKGIEVSRFELPGGELAPAAQARLLLAPFHAAILAAGRVRVLSYGPLDDVDFHALPFAGEPLLARRLVVYSLDLPARASPVPSWKGAALVVADPHGDLPQARPEGAAVSRAIRTWDWSLETLNSVDASAAAVREKLPGADLFHYAGHGLFAGSSGWDSVLELADDSSLTLGDILSLPEAPAWVVLSACEAGRTPVRAAGAGVGLAHAFVVAGAQSVIAANRPVDDRVARDLAVELYRGWKPGQDLAGRFRQTQLAYRQRNPEGTGWAGFRVLTP